MDHDNENPDSSTKTIDVGQLPVSNGHVMISVRNKLSGTSMFSMRLNTDERVAELKGVIINMGGLNVNTWRQLLLFFKEATRSGFEACCLFLLLDGGCLKDLFAVVFVGIWK